MERLTQILRNYFLRLEGFFSVIFRFLANLAKNFFGFFANIFGLTKTGYFLESDDAQGIKQAAAKQSIETQDTTSATPTTTRRRPNAKLEDYYINMARDVKKN